MDKFLKLDVTDRLEIKLDEEDILLFYGKDCIGMLVINEDGKQYDLVDGFIQEGKRIFRLFRQNDASESYTENCDLGWC
ncbi:DUF2553 family protein [Bacillus kexueae]|uniref:DUF2553 family protein n=1 Tax=Aeribacillus kexueae TaxID=2078952 RepID=UPI001FAEAB80|nr:DUF2553 family protein [Bacillus kexueae]